MKIDYSLYLVTDNLSAGNRSLLDVVKEAIIGGVTIVQYRDKNASTQERIKTGKAVHKITQRYGIPLIINDDVQAALEIGAEGVHVGQKDACARNVRELIGPNMILGVSVDKDIDQATQAVKDGADYLGIGPIFSTNTKLDAEKPMGLEVAGKISRSITIPCVGIGGINSLNAGSVIESGFKGVAVVSAIIGSSDPEKTAKNLLEQINSFRNKQETDFRGRKK